MNLNAEYAGNPYCERAKNASRAGVVLDAIEGNSTTLGFAKTGADGWQAYNLMRCVGKSASDVHRFYASLVVVMVLGVILLFVAVPSKWLEGCQVCTKYEARTVYRDGRAKQTTVCAESRAGSPQECRRQAVWVKVVAGILLSGFAVWIVHTVYVFRLKTRVFQPAGLIGTTLARSVL